MTDRPTNVNLSQIDAFFVLFGNFTVFHFIWILNLLGVWKLCTLFNNHQIHLSKEKNYLNSNKIFIQFWMLNNETSHFFLHFHCYNACIGFFPSLPIIEKLNHVKFSYTMAHNREFFIFISNIARWNIELKNVTHQCVDVDEQRLRYLFRICGRIQIFGWAIFFLRFFQIFYWIICIDFRIAYQIDIYLLFESFPYQNETRDHTKNRQKINFSIAIRILATAIEILSHAIWIPKTGQTK